jgi:hypothetical protein
VEVKPEVHGLLAAAQQSGRSMSFRRSVGSGGIDGKDGCDEAVSAAKTILHHVSGEALPGQVLAAMGPSGSGKTSLMNVLSGRAAYQEGTVSVNGRVLARAGMKRLMKKIAYVKQADIFFGHLTIRDQFSYTARLRLSASKDAIQREVDRILRLLRLQKVADSPIMMLSGGERKRVNIGKAVNDLGVLRWTGTWRIAILPCLSPSIVVVSFVFRCRHRAPDGPSAHLARRADVGIGQHVRGQLAQAPADAGPGSYEDDHHQHPPAELQHVPIVRPAPDAQRREGRVLWRAVGELGVSRAARVAVPAGVQRC